MDENAGATELPHLRRIFVMLWWLRSFRPDVMIWFWQRHKCGSTLLQTYASSVDPLSERAISEYCGSQTPLDLHRSQSRDCQLGSEKFMLGIFSLQPVLVRHSPHPYSKGRNWRTWRQRRKHIWSDNCVDSFRQFCHRLVQNSHWCRFQRRKRSCMRTDRVVDRNCAFPSRPLFALILEVDHARWMMLVT